MVLEVLFKNSVKSIAFAMLFFCYYTYGQNNNSTLFKAHSLYKNQQYNSLEEYIDKIRLKKQNSKQDLIFFKAVIDFQKTQYRQAVNQFLNLYFTDNNTFNAEYCNKNDIRIYIGLCYAQLSEYDSCLFYLTAMEREGLPVLGHLAIAKSLFNKKKYDDALVKYSGVLAMDTTIIEAYSNMGFIYHNEMDYNKAIEKFDKAITLDASIGDLYFARALSKIALKDYSACEDLIKAQQLKVEKAMDLFNKLCIQ